MDININDILNIGNLPSTEKIKEKAEKLEEDRQEKNSIDDKELMETCREFEAIFTYMMFKEMNKTVEEGGLVKKSQASKIFEDMFIEEVADQSSQDGGIGLAKMIYDQFKGGSIII